MTVDKARIGPYRIIGLLGRGGMGCVYDAYDDEHDRPVAVKQLAPELAGDETLRRRFRREARLAARLEHENICNVFPGDEASDDEGLPFFAMERLPGRTLSTIISSDGPIEADLAISITKQVAAALAHALDAGMIHRDIKPSNIVVDDAGRAKVTDFGLVRLIDGDSDLTSSGSFLGTATYASPESARGMPADERSDMYSLGATLYHMLAGRPPFSGDTPLSVIYQHCHEPVPSVTAVRPDLPRSLICFVEDLLQKSSEQRPKSYDELGERLAAIDLCDPAEYDAAGDASAASAAGDASAASATGDASAAGAAGDASAAGAADASRASITDSLATLLTTPPQSPVTYLVLIVIVVAVLGRAMLSPPPSQSPKTRAQAGPQQGRDFTNSHGMRLCWIPPGTFVQQCPEAKGSRHVTLSTGFWMGATETTQAQFEAVTGRNPSHFVGENLPVERVSWRDCLLVARLLTQSERRAGVLSAGGPTYRLPTEAEWEYACRAGTTTDFHWGAGAATAKANIASDEGAPAGLFTPAPMTVASFPANGFGLHDMHGNVAEWCLDWFAPLVVTESRDPVGAIDGSERVIRGGAFDSNVAACSAANRMADEPQSRSNRVGFRLVLASFVPAPWKQAAKVITGTAAATPRPTTLHLCLQKDGDEHLVEVEVAIDGGLWRSPDLVTATADKRYYSLSFTGAPGNHVLELRAKARPAAFYRRLAGDEAISVLRVLELVAGHQECKMAIDLRRSARRETG